MKLANIVFRGFKFWEFVLHEFNCIKKFDLPLRIRNDFFQEGIF